jgi:hypothetical protein
MSSLTFNLTYIKFTYIDTLNKVIKAVLYIHLNL